MNLVKVGNIVCQVPRYLAEHCHFVLEFEPYRSRRCKTSGVVDLNAFSG
jgi:hypothetical protein